MLTINNNQLADYFDMTTTLENLPKLVITSYTDQLRSAATATNALEFAYQYNGKPYRYAITVTTTEPNYGGLRYWWSCPKCRRRASALFCVGVFVCRQCAGVKYQTQHLQPLDRSFKKLALIRHRLGWEGGIAHGIQQKPKGMHQRTFDKLMLEYHKAARQIISGTAARLTKGIAEDEI